MTVSQVIKLFSALRKSFTSTCRRDRLPKDIPTKCLHKEKTQPKDKRSRVGRFNKPVVATKKIGNGRAALTSFQSTSSTNFTSVNATNEVDLCARPRERGRGRNKREWGIEMNESRDLYLNSHGKIDTVDSLVKNTRIGHRSHKCWHAGMNHGKKMAVVVACDMCKECCQGKLNPDWTTKPVDLFRFREKLSAQVLKHSPLNNEHVGDSRLRDHTKTPKRQRSGSRSPSVASIRRSNSSSSIDTQQTGIDKKLLEDLTAKGRCCGFLGPFRRHVDSIRPIANGSHRKCCVCGVDVHRECGICGDAVHYTNRPTIRVTPNGNETMEVLPGGVSKCFYLWHDTGCVGIPKGDWRRRFKNRKDWKLIESAALLEAHYDSVKRVHDERNVAVEVAVGVGVVGVGEGNNSNISAPRGDRS